MSGRACATRRLHVGESPPPLIAGFQARDVAGRLYPFGTSRICWADMTTFKERNRDFQELVRELHLVRQHNLSFKEGDPQGELLLFAEASLVLVTLERFLRLILGSDANESCTLPTLLDMACSERRNLLVLPGDHDTVRRQVTGVRNTLLHANYEQAAREAGCADVATYFKTTFAAEVEALYELVDNLVGQIDPDTGQRRT